MKSPTCTRPISSSAALVAADVQPVIGNASTLRTPLGATNVDAIVAPCTFALTKVASKVSPNAAVADALATNQK